MTIVLRLDRGQRRRMKRTLQKTRSRIEALRARILLLLHGGHEPSDVGVDCERTAELFRPGQRAGLRADCGIFGERPFRGATRPLRRLLTSSRNGLRSRVSTPAAECPRLQEVRARDSGGRSVHAPVVTSSSTSPELGGRPRGSRPGSAASSPLSPLVVAEPARVLRVWRQGRKAVEATGARPATAPRCAGRLVLAGRRRACRDDLVAVQQEPVDAEQRRGRRVGVRRRMADTSFRRRRDRAHAIRA